MSAIARVAYHIDSLKRAIPEHEGNFIIDSYFAYLAEDRGVGRDGRDGGDGMEGMSVCTDDCGEMAKKELAAMNGEEELLHEADANMELRLEAQRRAQSLITHPAAGLTASEELERVL
jgi:hypothetical protein